VHRKDELHESLELTPLRWSGTRVTRPSGMRHFLHSFKVTHRKTYEDSID